MADLLPGGGRPIGRLHPPRRLSATHARYFNMSWDGPARDYPLSDSISPRKPLSISAATDLPSTPALPHRRVNFPPVAEAYPFTLFENMPLEPDVEAGRSFWSGQSRSWFGSKLERKLRNPTACDSIGYEVHGLKSLRTFIIMLVFMLFWCLFLLLWDKAIGPVFSAKFLLPWFGELGPQVLGWGEIVIMLTGALLYSLGFHKFVTPNPVISHCILTDDSMRTARDQMKAVQHSAITTAYAFLKTLRDNHRSVSEIQPLI